MRPRTGCVLVRQTFCLRHARTAAIGCSLALQKRTEGQCVEMPPSLVALSARQSSPETIWWARQGLGESSNRHRLPSRPRRNAMGRIVVSENVSLDGVIQDPAGVEGFSRGGWVGHIGGQGRDEAAKVALDEALGAKAFLLGRRSYEFLAARWPSRSGPFADRLNSLPKYVVSSTLDAAGWNNTTVIRGDVINKVSKMKLELDGEILVAASFHLWPTRTEHDLVDELRLMIYPVVLGAGERLFGDSSEKKPMRLVSTRTVDDLALLIYEVVRLRS